MLAVTTPLVPFVPLRLAVELERAFPFVLAAVATAGRWTDETFLFDCDLSCGGDFVLTEAKRAFTN